MIDEFEAVIGLEIHVQLNTKTKMFCDCPNRPGDEPNRNTCPVCLWLPGALPRLSAEALEKATLAALALDCEISPIIAFDQKVYYYPDLPKGYQLSQFHKPLAKNGRVRITAEDGSSRNIGIIQVHMEEDVAKLLHEREGKTPVSLVDFNRAGTPLVEIVSRPDIRSSHEAMEYIKALRARVRYAGSSECSMEQGTMRVDANISIRPKGSDRFNTKVEVKNMNSIQNVGDAVDYEIRRQADQVRTGEQVTLHTRLWDPDKKMTVAMRGKFEGPCVPDPAVPPIVISNEWLETVRSRLPEMPARKMERFIEHYELPRDEASLMSADRDLADYFETVAKSGIPPRTACHWIAAQLLPLLKNKGLTVEASPLSAERLAGLLLLLEKNEINARAAREILPVLFESDEAPEAVVERLNVRQVSDTAALETLVDRIITDNPAAVDDYRSGTQKAFGFLMGQAMQASQGTGNPQLIKEILHNKLKGRS
ncbi:MAG: glutamyl-tRNA amidotransferase [delta proteobacterium MLS_D]|jgi:aspartyl-tRNA(Asn)/glutamyl-tRNA(Gln) amidotransferase subunit B|nr:MAG: glutamyl-tRNA amidotransferase [delta proteobacterium MLS_D]